jgi:hypothetical protein
VTEASLERIIENMQFFIVDARAMQLKMLARILSIALLEAYETRDKPRQRRPTSGVESDDFGTKAIYIAGDHGHVPVPCGRASAIGQGT